MALGIDIYRYQTVTDPRAVKRAGVAFAVVKATDGGGQAIVSADHQVALMKLAGIPVGLYHYAQLSPSPEIQADVLCKAVRRLGATGTPPALDLEDPHVPGGKARDFAQRFLRRVRANGFPYVLLYGNTSMLTGINAESLGVDNVLIWEANYGSNSGNRNPLPNRPWTRRIHQYTSLGTVPGISGKVDLNESLGPIPGVDGAVDMELTDKITFWDGFQITVGQALADTWQLANNLSGRPTRPDQPADTTPWITQLLAEATSDPDLTADAIAQIIRDNAPPPAAIDIEAVKQAVRDAAGEDNPALADAIVDNLVTRLGN